MALKKDKEALKDFDLAIAKRADNVQAITDRALLKAKKHQYKSAIADCNQAILIDPLFHKAYRARGYIKTLTQDFQNAVANYDQAIALDSKNPDYYQERGLLKIQLNQKESGCSDLKKAIESGGKNSVAISLTYCK